MNPWLAVLAALGALLVLGALAWVAVTICKVLFGVALAVALMGLMFNPRGGL